MKYNIVLKNNQALPIPYGVTVGDKLIRVDTLFTDKPLYFDVICLQGTNSGQLRLHGHTSDIVIEAHPGLEITVYDGTRTQSTQKTV